MLFTVVENYSSIPVDQRDRVFLVIDNWDDWFTFQTMYWFILVDENGKKIEVGHIKIGEQDIKSGKPQIPASFDSLDESFFSVGQGQSYYEALNLLEEGLKVRILQGLRDCAFDVSVYDRFKNEEVMKVSLLRDIKESLVIGPLHRLSAGDAQLTNFSFAFEFPAAESGGKPPSLTHEVVPGSWPPTNVHVLIGRNGVGKTRCLNNMIYSLVYKGRKVKKDYGRFYSGEDALSDPGFANLVSVSFSAFDDFVPPQTVSGESWIKYSYIGLNRVPNEEEKAVLAKADPNQKVLPKSLGDLKREFVESASRCRNGLKLMRWTNALSTLETDALFRDANITALSTLDEQDWRKDVNKLFEKLSSGHRIVLLTITRLVELVDERSLVLLDEPEGHLHPPLLSAFVRALSDLLIQRNGVAIVATHSPVILQETPMSCVWIVRRSGMETKADRPMLETFGENIGILTREVFGLEVTHSGFHRLLEKALSQSGGDYDSVLNQFEGKLGSEARAIAVGIIASGNENLIEEE